MTPITAHAYAKINLTLDVLNKRSDGYHSLVTVMQTISLCDSLEFSQGSRPGICLRCAGTFASVVPADSSNLAVRAAQSILDAAGIQSGIDILLHKRTPAQAGLGGGSSDAAATLLGVTRLLGLDIGPKLLHELASALGSDVPFFLSGGTAVVRGRGENVSPIVDAPKMWLVIVKPEECVSTAEAYGLLDAIENRASARATKQFEEAIKSGDIRRTVTGQSNDFEFAILTRLPRLAWLRDELQMAGALTAHLCGSGSAVYGVAKNEADAKQIAARLRARYTHVFVARTLSRIESDPLREREICD